MERRLGRCIINRALAGADLEAGLEDGGLLCPGGGAHGCTCGRLPPVRPLPRLLGCWLPGVSKMGSECLALQWGCVGRLLARKWACAPALEFGFLSSMAVAERRATSDLTRRRRDYSSRVKLFSG